MNRLAFNYIETKRNVVQIINEYYKHLVRFDRSLHPRITPSFTFDGFGGSDFKSSKTENSAINLADEEDIIYIKKVQSVMNSLREDDRKVMYYCFFEKSNHGYVASQLDVSTCKLSNMKHEAVKNFAYGLDCLVEK